MTPSRSPVDSCMDPRLRGDDVPTARPADDVAVAGVSGRRLQLFARARMGRRGWRCAGRDRARRLARGHSDPRRRNVGCHFPRRDVAGGERRRRASAGGYDRAGGRLRALGRTPARDAWRRARRSLSPRKRCGRTAILRRSPRRGARSPIRSPSARAPPRTACRWPRPRRPLPRPSPPTSSRRACGSSRSGQTRRSARAGAAGAADPARRCRRPCRYPRRRGRRGGRGRHRLHAPRDAVHAAVPIMTAALAILLSASCSPSRPCTRTGAWAAFGRLPTRNGLPRQPAARRASRACTLVAFLLRGGGAARGRRGVAAVCRKISAAALAAVAHVACGLRHCRRILRARCRGLHCRLGVEHFSAATFRAPRPPCIYSPLCLALSIGFLAILIVEACSEQAHPMAPCASASAARSAPARRR